jgi:thiamine pyrophosphate-dependent acetolactate synthase large subunit-like protein
MSATRAGTGDRSGLTLDQRLERLTPLQRALVEQRLEETGNGHSAVARTLASLGVTHVYGVPGQPVYDTFAACARAQIRAIGTHHQHPAALMAAAHNYFAGHQRAASIVSAGVPAANAIGAVTAVRDNCWPLVMLVGAAPQAADNTGYFMALDATALYRPVTKWAARVSSACGIPAALSQAFQIAMDGRPGPVLVELPEDVLTGFLHGHDGPPPASAVPCPLEPDLSSVQRVAAALTGAKRPLLIVGKGVRWAAPFTELRELVDALSLPFITSPIGRGAIPDDHPLCMNGIRWIAQAQADVVLMVGARFDWTFRYGRQIPPEAFVIQVDVHAPELSRGSRIDLGVHADAGRFVRALLDETRRRQAHVHLDRGSVAALRQSRDDVQAAREAEAGRHAPLISPLRLAIEVRAALPDDAISIFDGNLTMAACERVIPVQLPASRLTPGTSGGLGGGIPYAIAAKLEHPERPVVAICGDFAFTLSAMELETAVRHNVPIVVVIANNSGNAGSLRQRMHMDADCEPIMMFQEGLRYDRISEALGGAAEHVEHACDIGPAIARAIAANRPACVNVVVDRDAEFPANDEPRAAIRKRTPRGQRAWRF